MAVAMTGSITDLLTRCGRVLYGRERFTGLLAGDLGVNERTVRAWLSGRMDPPAGVWHDIYKLLCDRGDDIDDVAAEIEVSLRGDE